MFSAQIGSPHVRFPKRSLLSSPSILTRRNGPLFSGTPPPTSNSAWQYNYSPYATPAPSTLIPSTDFSPPATFSSSTTSTIQNFSNVLRWDDDGHLHPIEFFIKQYGGSAYSALMRRGGVPHLFRTRWTTRPHTLRPCLKRLSLVSRSIVLLFYAYSHPWGAR